MVRSAALSFPSDRTTIRQERAIYGYKQFISRSTIPVLTAATLSVLSVAACDVAWGGASIALENPAPVPEETEAETGEGESIIEPLPTGDLLYLVRFTDAEGGVRLVTAARLVDGVPTDLGLPQAIDDSYRARYDSAFHTAGLELTLHAAGGRIGTVILDGTTTIPDASCQTVADGHALLLPGAVLPEFAFAWAGEGASGAAAAYRVPETDTRMSTFGPVLAENLLRQGGENRPYLAQRAGLQAVPWAGDDRPAMAATYLVNDGLANEPPANAASSLFVLARFDRTRGYVPEWSEVRRYGNGTDREAFTYLGAMAGSAGRVDFVTRHDGSGVSLAASVANEGGRGIDWTEARGVCSALALADVADSN